ncbi:MAG TPA: amidase [Planctomycetaceae bacterium]|nr:amidase [Planctomycetaceae bacterium]
MFDRAASQVSRRQLLSALAATGIGGATFHRALAGQTESALDVTPEMIESAAWIADVELDDDEKQQVASAVERHLKASRRLRAVELDVSVSPSQVFRPDLFYAPGDQDDGQPAVIPPIPGRAPDDLPTNPAEIAFASIATQAHLLAAGKLTSRQLTEIYLERLNRFDNKLQLIVTLLETDALAQATASDQRRANGNTLGPLDGIPWLAKDLLAMAPHKTTWGAEPFQDQVRDETATVASRLAANGAVCLAKVSLGALAWGDVWFGGKTRNPWNTQQGSSGSSAGSAAGVAAGLATFAIGSETLGSIVSPTRRCRTNGLRGTFGRVSRYGCMPLAWSMDKIGPIARHIDDLGYVFAAIAGPDGLDPTLVDRPFDWKPESKPFDVSQLKIGVTKDRKSASERAAIQLLEDAGATLVDIDLSTELPVSSMSFILGAEAASAFENRYRDEPSANYGLWNNEFATAPFYSALTYIRANRLRSQLISSTETELRKVDCVIGANDLLLTNLTGHPSLVVSCDTDEISVREPQSADAESEGSESSDEPQVIRRKVPGVVKLTAAAYQEQRLLEVGAWLQNTAPPTPLVPDEFA